MEIVGVDPGLVHTGVVIMRFLGHVKTVEVLHEVVPGPNAKEVQLWIYRHSCQPSRVHKIPTFIESYRERANAYSTDTRMRLALENFRKELPHAKVLDNMGVKKIVTQPLMELLGVWKFSTPTHHQDLRSAARIALYGALKDDQLNRRIYDIVDDHLNGRTWDVRHL